jgi:glutamyl-tRNA synthetase
VVKTLPKHKKNPEVGEKKTVYTSSILVDQDDALSFEDNEEVRWFFLTRRLH